jgi:ribosome-binding factor A
MSDRVKKINELIREKSSEALARIDSHGALITVKAVETSPDLRHSTVWVSVLGDSDLVMKEIIENKGHLSKEIVAEMTTKYSPRLSFRLDHSEEYIQNIESLLKNE